MENTFKNKLFQIILDKQIGEASEEDLRTIGTFKSVAKPQVLRALAKFEDQMRSAVWEFETEVNGDLFNNTFEIPIDSNEINPLIHEQSK